MLIVMVALTFSAKSQNCNSSDQALIAKARIAARDCIRPYTQHGVQVKGSIETVSACFYQGFIKKVTFYTYIPCVHPPCPMVMSVLVATVYFNCDNNVSQVECAN